MIAGTLSAYYTHTPTTSHWASSSDAPFGFTIYIGISAFILNLVISVVLTVIFKALRAPEGPDETLPHQYTADPEEAPAPTPAEVGVTS
jgi:SSS family solute:Na+ symporter